jgi:hypothetical protein
VSISKSVSVVISFFLVSSLLSGCLTADKKEVHIKLNPDGKSGSGSILFSDVASSPGDSVEAVNEDFSTLIAQYYEAHKAELEKGMKNIHKRLFVQDGKLMGEITFNFDDVSDLGFYRYKNSGPYMFYTVADGFFTSGQYEASNGTYMGEKLPVIFWEPGQRELYYDMALSTPQEPRTSLLDAYNRWQSKQQH